MKKTFSVLLAVIMLCLSLGVSAETENYYLDETTEFVIGSNSCAVSSEFDYTVYSFRPDEIGKYTITTDDGVIGMVSNNGMWVTVEAIDETVVNSKSINWDCSGVGQSIWFAVKSDKPTVNVTVEWEELIIVTIPRTEYIAKTEPATFEFTGNFDALEYVDTFDEVANEAVLGEDGFYHLDSAEGPVLYAKLDDSLMSLLDAYGYGQLVAVIYDDEGHVVEKIDFNAAFYEYYLCADPTNCIYPLTDDLITIYKEMGKSNSWYGADGWVGGELDDAWMFACYYSNADGSLGDVNQDGEIDQYDYLLVKRHYFGTRYLTEAEASLADVNADGAVNQYDYILIKRHYFGTYTIG
ncbi:MAG: hypothetical protein E7595_02130 [Ruminococcaceae bacterium]|nr:hypothetical protein [Oscillospiraceae bacterium]